MSPVFPSQHTPPFQRHPHPRPRLRRAGARLILIGLTLAATAFVFQIIIGLVWFPKGALFLGTAFFTAVLSIPLVMGSVLHPALSLSEAGLMLYPMIWRPQFVPWNCLIALRPHPLLYENEGAGRLMFGRNYQPRRGAAILVDPRAGLIFPYRILGGLMGAGWQPAFAISSAAHRDYDALLAAIQAHVPDENGATP